MPEEIMMAVASALAGKAADAVWHGAKEALERVVSLARRRLSGDPAASDALKRAKAGPDREAALPEIVRLLSKLAEEDPLFAAELRALGWAEPIKNSQVTNTNTGKVGGHLIQAGDLRVQGGLWLGDVRGKSNS